MPQNLPTKTDYVGLATTGLELRTNGAGKSATWLQKNKRDGSVGATLLFGEVGAPTCDYVITAKIDKPKWEIGKVHGTGTIPYALQQLVVATSAGGEPSVSASSVQIESGAKNTVCTYAIPDITLDPSFHALDFGAFEYTASDSLDLQDSTLTVSADINPPTINGVPKASDAVGGLAVVSCTFWAASDTTAPSVSPKTGWELSSAWNCTGADGDFFTWTATFTKKLTPTVHTAAA